MTDVFLFSGFFISWTVIGLPFCLLLPVSQFEFRYFAAPCLGYGVLGVGSTILYGLGIFPQSSLIIFSSLSILFLLILLLFGRNIGNILTIYFTFKIISSFIFIVILCLLPTITGGPEYTAFQGNVYDQLNSYLAGSAVFHHETFSDLASLDENSNPIFVNAHWILEHRPTVSIIHSALSNFANVSSTVSNYAYHVALQANMFFAALFIVTTVFGSNIRNALLASIALTLGFFEQYVFDLNAWSQLASQPNYLLLVGFVSLATNFRRFSQNASQAVMRIAGFGAPLMASVAFLYPDALPVFGPACVAACIVGFVKQRHDSLVGILGLAAGGAVAFLLVLLFKTGTLDYFLRSVTAQAFNDVDWWRHFQRHFVIYLENDFMILSGHSSVNILTYIYSIFSIPVESIMGVIGLYYLLPVGGPTIVDAAWKLVLYIFIISLIINAVRNYRLVWINEADDASASVLTACIIGCVVPILILFAGKYWTAGKALSMASPLLFIILVAPFLVQPSRFEIKHAPVIIFLLGHLALGVARPVVALEAFGGLLPSMPGSNDVVREQRGHYDWDRARWIRLMRGCNRVAIDLDQPFIRKMAATVLTDIGTPWSTLQSTQVGGNVAKPFEPEKWEEADCVATASIEHIGGPRRVIWLDKDESVLDFLYSTSGELEIGVNIRAGVTSTGTFGIEETQNGPLQWTSGNAQFVFPNNVEAPANFLVLSIWPMPLADGATLKLAIDGVSVFDGDMPNEPVRVSLEEFASLPTLTIQIVTYPTTRYEFDPRDLGLAIKDLRLLK